MTLEERVSALEKELDGLRRGKYLSSAEKELRENALHFARLKTMGFYVDASGTRILVYPNDTYIEVARQNMERAAERLLQELSLEGGQ